MGRTKRVAIIADLHCGHRAGLTPPRWRYRVDSDQHIWHKFSKIQDEAWAKYRKIVRAVGKVDILIVNGDTIDGRGERSGGVELITGDRNEQVAMAVECIKVWTADKVRMVRGTPYHTGDIESWEDLVAQQVGAKIGDHEWFSVNGRVFDCKHHIGGSSVQYGRLTQANKDELWNLVWAELEQQPRGDYFIRSHVHYCEGSFKWVKGVRKQVIITPALQTMGTRFGARRCSGIVHWGLVALDVHPKGFISW